MKMYQLTKVNATEQAIRVKYCKTFWSKLLGLMFVRDMQPNEGIIIVEHSESKLNTSIHMFFMHFDITVLWLDKNLTIVDKALAKKWKPYYASKVPAQYVVELHASRILDFEVGEKLHLTKETELS